MADGFNFESLDVSSNGYVSGEYTTNGTNYFPFRWTPGSGMQSIGLPAGGSGILNADVYVNASGDVVGTTETSTGSEGFYWSQSNGFQTLDLPGGADTNATGINDAGQVSGYANVSGHLTSFTWTVGGGFQVLSGGNSNIESPTAQAINSAGAVAGGADVIGGLSDEAFLWTSAHGFQALGALPGDSFSDARGIGANGTVVGFSESSGGVKSPVVWASGGGIVDLGLLPGFSSGTSNAINSAGQIVGFLLGNGIGHGFVDTAGTMTDLNSVLVGNVNGWSIDTGSAINDSGQIAAVAISPDGAFHAVLLHPVPEPATFALAAIGALGVLTAARHRRR